MAALGGVLMFAQRDRDHDAEYLDAAHLLVAALEEEELAPLARVSLRGAYEAVDLLSLWALDLKPAQKERVGATVVVLREDWERRLGSRVERVGRTVDMSAVASIFFVLMLVGLASTLRGETSSKEVALWSFKTPRRWLGAALLILLFLWSFFHYQLYSSLLVDLSTVPGVWWDMASSRVQASPSPLNPFWRAEGAAWEMLGGFLLAFSWWSAVTISHRLLAGAGAAPRALGLVLTALASLFGALAANKAALVGLHVNPTEVAERSRIAWAGGVAGLALYTCFGAGFWVSLWRDVRRGCARLRRPAPGR